jgi:hypothetical protein
VFVVIHQVVKGTWKRLINYPNNRNLGVIHKKGGRKTISDRLFYVKYQNDTSLVAKRYASKGKKYIQK